MRYTLLVILCICISISSVSYAQNDQDHIIPSLIFEKDRELKIFLPPKYFQDSTKDYTVTYILDAQSDQVWYMTKGIIEYLVQKNSVLPMIVVGVVSDNRRTEFNPLNDKLQKHLQKEVFPFIEKTYRVNQFRAVVGHSWGGAFIGQTLFGPYSDLFNAYLCISGSLSAKSNMIFNQADSLLQANHAFQKFFYYSAAEVGFEREYETKRKKMEDLLSKYSNNTLAWSTQHFAGLDHFSTFMPSLTAGLVCMSRNYWIDQKAIEDLSQKNPKDLIPAIKAFYKTQEANLGITFKPDSYYLKIVADDFSNQEKWATAISIYKWALEQEPENIYVNVSLAETYDNAKEKESAKVAFNRSLQLLEAKKEEVSEEYFNIFHPWLVEKVAEYK